MEHCFSAGTDISTYTREAPGMSAFALSDGVVYHTYSAYARGLDALWGMYSGLTGRRRGAMKLGRRFGGTTSTHEHIIASKQPTSSVGILSSCHTSFDNQKSVSLLEISSSFSKKVT